MALDRIVTTVLRRAEELDIMVHHVPRDEERGIIATIRERYGQPSHEGALWECLVSSASLYDPSGWSRIGELADGPDITMIIDDLGGPSGITWPILAV